MDSVMFFPWIGKKYKKGGIFGKKILILGEAHYCETPDNCGACRPGERNDCNAMTKKVIENQISDTGKKHAIFTKLAKLFLDKDSLSEADKNDFWNSVSYYNYVQTSVSDKARVAPNSEMWSISEMPFNEVMKKLEPDFLLILGFRLWENMAGQEGVDWPVGPVICNDHKTWYYKGKRKRTLSLIIHHPSSFTFSYDYIPIVKHAISLS